jgi:hypothetical protein
MGESPPELRLARPPAIVLNIEKISQELTVLEDVLLTSSSASPTSGLGGLELRFRGFRRLSNELEWAACMTSSGDEYKLCGLIM